MEKLTVRLPEFLVDQIEAVRISQDFPTFVLALQHVVEAGLEALAGERSCFARIETKLNEIGDMALSSLAIQNLAHEVSLEELDDAKRDIFQAWLEKQARRTRRHR